MSSIISLCQASDVIIRAKENHNVCASIHACIHPCASIFYLLCVSSRHCKNGYSHLASALIRIFLKQKNIISLCITMNISKKKKIHIEGKTAKESKN